MVEVFCYQHHIGKYEDATRGFSLIQHGAYLRLIQLYYKTVGKLPNDIKLLCRMLSCQSKAERDAVAYAVAEKFTIGEDGFLRNSGAENELQRITKVSEENRRKAYAKHLKDKERRLAAALPGSMPEGCREDANSSTNQLINLDSVSKEDTESISPPPPLIKSAEAEKAEKDFEEFWTIYPRRVAKGSALRAYKTARKKVDHETIMSGVRRYQRERSGQDPTYTAHPATWLNGCRWGDQPSNIGSNSVLGVTGKGGANSNGREPRGVVAAALRVAARLEEKDAFNG